MVDSTHPSVDFVSLAAPLRPGVLTPSTPQSSGAAHPLWRTKRSVSERVTSVLERPVVQTRISKSEATFLLELDGNCINGTLFDPFRQLPSNSGIFGFSFSKFISKLKKMCILRFDSLVRLGFTTSNVAKT